MRERVTVCMVVYNGASTLPRSLAALVRETDNRQIPLLIVDHASTDATPAILIDWRARVGERLRLARFTGKGISAVRNHAWRNAESAWVVFVDADCEVQPGWADALGLAMDRHALNHACAAVGGRNGVPHLDRPFYRALQVLLGSYVGGHSSILNRDFREPREVDHCPTLNVAFRRSALTAVNGFDPKFTRVGEDLDLSYRLKKAGFQLWAEPGMRSDHALRPSLPAWLANMVLYGRGRFYFNRRHPEAREWKFLLPAAVVVGYFITFALALVASPWFLFGYAALHFTGVAAGLWSTARRTGAALSDFALATVTTWATHLAYGWGFLSEIRGRSAADYTP